MKKWILLLLAASTWSAAHANQDYLIQVTPEAAKSLVQLQSALPTTTQVEKLNIDNWVRIKTTGKKQIDIQALKKQPGVLLVQPNYRIFLYDNPQLQVARTKSQDDCPIPGMCDGEDNPFPPPGPGDEDCPVPIPGFCDQFPPDDGGGGPFPPPDDGGGKPTAGDNPEIPMNDTGGSGDDPLFASQWGMNDLGIKNAWRRTFNNRTIIVGVIDTGVDYTHEDLRDNLWRNPGEVGLDSQGREKAKNGIDDDQNGYIDDVIGWDFVSNDNRPYDLMGNIMQGGNPGHGTHCAGNVAATSNNGKGIAGVAPNAKVMVLRFISDQGQGTTADAIKAIRYAVDNGALVTSNSWGSEGEDPSDSVGNQALRDAIQYAQDKGTLFVAAAGNGRQTNPFSPPKGYNNDTDSKPAYPASYAHDNIISVAAIDVSDSLGSFSNFGVKTVDIGAPGVKVFSTIVGNKYADSMLNGQASWDGTSMATPHVAGAAALYWGKNPNLSWQDIKAAIITSAQKTNTLSNKVLSGGKLDVDALLK